MRLPRCPSFARTANGFAQEAQQNITGSVFRPETEQEPRRCTCRGDYTEACMSKIDDAADKVKSGTDKAAEKTKDAANSAGDKMKNAGDKLKKQGH